MNPRGLAHECRVEATKIRHAELLTVTVDRDAMAGLLERCATSLEEMDAADRAAGSSLDDIEAQALGVYRRSGGAAGRLSGNLAECIVSLCAYLKKEKAIG